MVAPLLSLNLRLLDGGATNRSICGRAFRSSVTLKTTAERMAEGDRREAREQVGVLGLVPVRRRTGRARRRTTSSPSSESASVGSSQVLKVCSGSSWRARSSSRLQASWAVSVMTGEREN